MNDNIYTVKEISELVAPIAQRYGIPAVYLFGSYARGDATTKSDIDLIVDTEGTGLNSLFSLGALYGDFEEALMKSIDLITERSLTQHTVRQSDLLFRENIRKERVMLYG